MAEAEDVLSDAARHATIFAKRLWRHYRPLPERVPTVTLRDVAPRLDLLITALSGQSMSLRVAQRPPYPTMLERLFRRVQSPYLRQPLPSTDGRAIWLPADSGVEDEEEGLELYRALALQQIARAMRGSAAGLEREWPALRADAYLLLEAWAADQFIVEELPGAARGLARLRARCLRERPPIDAFSRGRRPFEALLIELLQAEPGAELSRMPQSPSPKRSAELSLALLEELGLPGDYPQMGKAPLLKDWWTGELRPPPRADRRELLDEAEQDERDEDERAPGESPPPRSAQLDRRPEVREAEEDEDDDESEGIFMVQLDEPHLQAEDPFGLNRPVDRDEDISADDYGDMLSDVSEARLVATPGRPKEVLMSDDPPDSNTAMQLKTAIASDRGIYYPEWDYRSEGYRSPGARLFLLPNLPGSERWVEETLEEHRGLLNQIRRRFEMLSAQRVTRRRLNDGDEIDLLAYVDGYADFRAGGVLPEALYQTRRTAARDLAITLLVDVSGSTDGWVSAHRRIIDVEREALLLVSVALEGMGEPWSILAFSGEGPDAVIIREIKTFEERYHHEVALRISALEPEHYTRAGAAIRHATASLMRQPASHRLLLVLSDGKPNDRDVYEGRYGVEDTRQAVIEANLQGISAFCLTIDRQAPAYLPRIFGATNYALLQRPELLPTALLEWMKRLVVR